MDTSERKQYLIIRSTVCLGLKISLDSHIPYLDRNCFISWEDHDEFMENFFISLEDKKEI